MVRLALQAMATRFELVLHGDDAVALRAAGEEALREISLLESQLSFYDPASEISRINRDAARKPVRVSARVFTLLESAREYHELTNGAFDISVGPLMECWGFVRGSGTWPDSNALSEARGRTGMHGVLLDEHQHTVRFDRHGMLIDLGAIGKGYAIEEAANTLRECGVTCALLHGGTSTMVAIGTPPDSAAGWPIAVAHPSGLSESIARVQLQDEAMSVSAVRGKAFEYGGKIWGHVIDPRSGFPVQGAELAAVTHPSATLCDALSTAYLALERTEMEQIACNVDSMRLLVAYRTGDKLELHITGIESE